MSRRLPSEVVGAGHVLGAVGGGESGGRGCRPITGGNLKRIQDWLACEVVWRQHLGRCSMVHTRAKRIQTHTYDTDTHAHSPSCKLTVVSPLSVYFSAVLVTFLSAAVWCLYFQLLGVCLFSAVQVPLSSAVGYLNL